MRTPPEDIIDVLDRLPLLSGANPTGEAHPTTAACLPPVDREPAAAPQSRVAHLLSALFLARVDGKSPVECPTEDAHPCKVRPVAHRFPFDPSDWLAGAAQAWREDVRA